MKKIWEWEAMTKLEKAMRHCSRWSKVRAKRALRSGLPRNAMRQSTQWLIVAAVILNAVIAVWGLLEPSQRDLRVPLWLVQMLMLGAIFDRFICKRT